MRVFIYKLFVATFLLNALTVVAIADALDNWTPGMVSTNPIGYEGFMLSGIAYGNGRYVAVGQYFVADPGLVETSDDGTNWTIQTQEFGYNSVLDLYSVTYGKGTFVASGWDSYGIGNLYSSPDGINWTPHVTQILNLYAVTYGAGVFVAVGDGVLQSDYAEQTNRNIYTSPDGINWTPRNSGSPANDVQVLSDVAYGNGKFVAVGANQSYFFTSASGTSWTRAASSFPLSGNVSFCNGLFFAPTGPGTNLVSADGSTWSVRTNNTSSTFGRMMYTNGLYMALSGSGPVEGQFPPTPPYSSSIFSSVDGTNWIQDLNMPTNNDLFSIAFGGRNLVAVGFEYGSTDIGLAYISDPLVAVGMNRGFPPRVKISGVQGLSYGIQYSPSINPANWQTVTNFTLSNSPSVWTDTSATNSQQYYRAALLP